MPGRVVVQFFPSLVLRHSAMLFASGRQPRLPGALIQLPSVELGSQGPFQTIEPARFLTLLLLSFIVVIIASPQIHLRR